MIVNFNKINYHFFIKRYKMILEVDMFIIICVGVLFFCFFWARTKDETYVENFDTEIEKTDEEIYDSQCRKINLAAFLIPFFLAGLPIFFALGCDIWFLSLPIALFVALGAGLIGMIIGHSINIKRAKTEGIPDNNPRVQYEKNERNIAIIGGVVSMHSLYKKGKSTIKDIENVDGWSKK